MSVTDQIEVLPTGGGPPCACAGAFTVSTPWMLGVAVAATGIAAVALVWAALLHWMMWGYAAHNHDASGAEHYRRRALFCARLGGPLGLICGVTTLIAGVLVGFPAGDGTAWWAFGIVLVGVGAGSGLWFLGLDPPARSERQDVDHTDTSGFE